MKKTEKIYLRKDGRWEGRYKMTQAKGKTSYRSVYAKDYEECLKKLNKAVSMEKGTDTVTLNDIIEHWLKSNKIRVKPSTESKYRFMFKSHIYYSLGRRKISEITSTETNEFLENKLKNGRKDGKGALSPSYVRTLAIIIDCALKFAVDDGFCPDIKLKIFKPAPAKHEISILKRKEQDLLTDMIFSSKNNIALGIYIALNTGMRIGEICALKWKDIDLKEKIIYVRNTVSTVFNEVTSQTENIINSPKSLSSKREIPISSALFPMLSDLKPEDEEFFVVSGSADFFGTGKFNYRYRKFMEQNRLENVNFHTLRHTFATRCVEAGVDVKTLSEILGHANISTTLGTYVHPSMEAKRKQLEKLYK